MATELHSMNYITHHLERLPIADTYGPDKFPTLLYYRNYNDANSKGSKHNKINTRNEIKQDHNNRSLFEFHATLNQSKARKPESETKTRTTQGCKIEDCKTSNSFCTVENFRDDSARDCAFHGGNSSFRACIPSSNKRKRSTDSTDSDSSKLGFDEEVKLLSVTNNIIRETDQAYTKPETHPLAKDNNDEFPPCFKKQFNRMQVECKKRPRNRPALDFNVMQRQASSSWFPFRFQSAERKVKIIKVTPIYCNRDYGQDNVCHENLKRDAYFRPIAIKTDE